MMMLCGADAICFPCGGQSCACAKTGEISEIREVTTTTLISLVSWTILRSKIQMPDALKQFSGMGFLNTIKIGIRFFKMIQERHNLNTATG